MHAVLALVAHSAAFKGALTGFGSAAIVDIDAFLQWKSVDDARTYDYRRAILRWIQGAVSGAIVGTGYGALIA